MKIYLIRHAKSLANERHVWTGLRDIPLSPRGIAEQHELCARFAYPHAEIYFSSPLSRCTESLEIIYGRQADMIFEDFTECALGILEGKPYMSLDDDPNYLAWISSPEIPVEGGESFRAFTDRACRGFEKLIAYCRARHAASAAGIMHGDVIRAILCRFVDSSIPHDRWLIPNGGMYALDIDAQCKVAAWQCAPDFIFSK